MTRSRSSAGRGCGLIVSSGYCQLVALRSVQLTQTTGEDAFR
jgi:hypothetical protein